MTRPRHLRLVPPQSEPLSGTCRTVGCCCALTDALGFCDTCRADYEYARAQTAEHDEHARAHVRRALPDLFDGLAESPELAELLAAHLVAHASDPAELSSLSLAALDDFFAEAAHRSAAL